MDGAMKLAVPICVVGSTERQRIVEHFLALNAIDRYWRFAFAASEEHIRRWTKPLAR